MDKPALRRHYLALRSAIPAEERMLSEREIVRYLSELPGVSVAGYVAMRGEVDVIPALAALAVRGVQTALPVMDGRMLRFRAWKPGETLAPGQHGVQEPAQGTYIEPEIVLVPLVAFDRAGYRVGYGGGYYDRTLEQLRNGSVFRQALGVAFGVQEVPVLPRESHDAKLDLIITEAETISV